MNKKYWSVLLAVGVIALAGCSDVVEESYVAINPNASTEELTQQAAAADQDSLKQIIAAYDNEIAKAQKNIVKQTNEIGKYKVVELKSEAAKQDIALLDSYKANAEKLAADKMIFDNALAAYQK